MSVKTRVVERASGALAAALPGLEQTLEERLKSIAGTGGTVPEEILTKLKNMSESVHAAISRGADEFVGIRDEELVTFKHDGRQPFSVVGPVLLVVLALILLPGSLKLFALPLFLYAAFDFLRTFVLRSKVDVPEGFVGVVCRNGQPTDRIARPGRTWCLNYQEFVPFLVSLREQVVNLTVAGFTGNYATVSLHFQVVIKVVDPKKFITTTSPSGIMKMLALYARCYGQRMVTSIEDARVKFTGRDNVENLMEALNEALREQYGIEVVRVPMSSSENHVLTDLERIRTELNQVDALNNTGEVNRQRAVKEVEQELRVTRKDTRNKAFELQQRVIGVDTAVSAAVDSQRQFLTIQTRRELATSLSELHRALSELTAAKTRAAALEGNEENIELDLKLRLARVRMNLMTLMKPTSVTILNVDGLGVGAGMSMGNKLIGGLLSPSQPETATEAVTAK